jgi:hypothetical protein
VRDACSCEGLCILDIPTRPVHRRSEARRPSSCSVAPPISVMRSSHARQSHDSGAGGRSFLRRWANGRVTESRLHPLAVVVRDVLEKDTPQMLLVHRDDMVKQFATHRPNPACRKSLLPWGPVGRRLRFDSELLDPIKDSNREDRVADSTTPSRG